MANLRKKQKRYKKRQAVCNNIPKPSQVIFTIPIVKILKDALAYFEVILLANDNRPIPNLELAQVTFYEVKQKITNMLEREEWGEVKPLDYNEVWILYTSLTMYLAVLQGKEERARLALCLQLRKQFGALIEAAK